MLKQLFPGRYVAITYRATQAFMAEKLKSFKIGYGQFPFLNYLNRCGHSSQEEITQALFFDKGTTARALKKLEDNGFVTRSVSPHDQRCNVVDITESGKIIVVEIRKILRDWNNTITAGLSPEEKNQTDKILITLAENAARAVKELPRQQTDRRQQ